MYSIIILLSQVQVDYMVQVVEVHQQFLQVIKTQILQMKACMKMLYL
jgi:hypothetical protein